MKEICISNLPDSATAEEVRVLCEKYGAVHSIDLQFIKGKPRGLAYVVMEDDEQADRAIACLHN